MRVPLSFGTTTVVLALASLVSAQLGSTCTTPLGAGTSGPNDPFWRESIKHQGRSPFNPDPNGYVVFRNVKVFQFKLIYKYGDLSLFQDFGAVGDGVADDTAAIKTYLVSAPIVPYYYTQLIGDAKNPPTLLAAASFDGMAMIDANPYIPGGNGAQYWTNQNNFHRSVRNFVIDVRRVPPERPQGTGIHWQVAQATSLINIVYYMSDAPNTAHQGIWMENGSGGFMGDMVFNGGKFGIWGGNQQFTVRNITVNNAQTCIYSSWNWGWTYQGLTFNNCQVGFDIATGGLTEATQTTGALAIIDAVITNVPIFIRNSQPSNNALAGSLVLNNVRLNNVPVAVGVVGGAVVLTGGTTTITSWGQGNVYRGTNPGGLFTKGNIPAPTKPASLLDSAGRIVSRTHPQYGAYAVSQFVSVKDNGARGDGVTDDTAALRDIFAKFSGCKIIFFDAGTYVVTDTLTIPAGTRMVGEAWTILAGRGPSFQDQNNPKVVFRVGAAGSQGIMEITDIVFTTIGPAGGAIVVEWNVREPAGVKAGAGMWDSHIRTAGAAGTNLEADRCPTSGAGGFAACSAAFMSLHLTPQSTAYLEGTWVWLSDHDLDLPGERRISVYSGRGILSESQGPVWLIGTAEHHTIYQYNLVNAANHYMGLIQTESPYFQPNPVAPTPFSINAAYKDPTPYSPNPSAWALHIKTSRNILIFGAGLYSFFTNYAQTCLATSTCQSQLADIDSLSASTGIHIYSLSTVGTTYQVSVNAGGIVNQASNINGFASTITSWSQS
ncbi:hypothetical protein NLJ89_g9279 [Agrocybe chaxingu]|uniref:Rhamnogalacturonase A/B/Epimerase-like pectate lyase domain-containing protein n=1 Tax=Agrocybe chaxingu TaxID=84603 RepID=A0A9W8MT96_9AGAR|nr:hypothetical protein NLJ89_g9279 [Agrocybe chaxingu]